MISPPEMLQQESETFFHSSKGAKPKQLTQKYFFTNKQVKFNLVLMSAGTTCSSCLTPFIISHTISSRYSCNEFDTRGTGS